MKMCDVLKPVTTEVSERERGRERGRKRMGNEEKKNEYRRKCSVKGFLCLYFFLVLF